MIYIFLKDKYNEVSTWNYDKKISEKKICIKKIMNVKIKLNI
jgi:hypothetical protein